MARSLLVLAFVVGCGSDKDEHGDSGHSHTSTMTSSCDDGTPVDEYVVGLSKTGANGYTVTFVSADPAPPDVGLNTWVLSASGPGDAALSDEGLVITPFMPLHGHGTTPPEFSGAAGGDGTWTFLSMDLFMPGLWEETVEVRDAAGATLDSVVFRFCLEG